MCLKLALMLSLAANSPIPRADSFGRFPTLNKMGYVDPQSNRIVAAFVQWAKEKTPFELMALRQQYVLEIGGGFGFVAKRLAENGSFFLFNDLSLAHIEIAKQVIGEQRFDSQYEILAGHFPYNLEELSLHSWQKLQGIGAFMVLHFLPPRELERFLNSTFNLLQPGGRIFLTAGTPYNQLFAKFRDQYEWNLRRFQIDPAQYFAEGKMPGEIPDATVYNPAHENQYPKYFHALEPDTLNFLLERAGFVVLDSNFIQRPSPSSQAVPELYSVELGEMVGTIAEKPVK